MSTTDKMFVMPHQEFATECAICLGFFVCATILCQLQSDNLAMCRLWSITFDLTLYMTRCCIMLGSTDYRNKNHLLPDECSLNMNNLIRLHNFFGITGFLDFVHSPAFLKLRRTQRFRKWICFCPQVRGWETPTLFSPLERANLNHWTRSQKQMCFRNTVFFLVLEYWTTDVQKLSNPECYTPSSEPIRIYFIIPSLTIHKIVYECCTLFIF
jgi:hypothetical protein